MQNTRINILLFFLIIVDCFFNIFLINQYNLPDGVHHFRRYDLVITKTLPQDFLIYLKDFDMYNISFISSVLTQLFPNFNSECLIDWSNEMYLADSCQYKYFLGLDFSYKGFGYDTQLHDYSKIYFSPHNIALLIYLSFILLFIFIILNKIIQKKEIFYLSIFFLYFPSVSSNFGYISPNIISSYGQLFLFLFFINKKYISYFLISIILTFMDFQNISNVIIISLFSLFFVIEKSIFIRINFLYLSILSIIIISILAFIKFSGLLDYLFLLFFPEIRQDYAYLNIGDHNTIKSLGVLFISLYYVGGSMTHPAFLLEYLVFFLISIYFFYLSFLQNSNFLNNIFLNPQRTYFAIGIFTVLIILLLFPNISQGRYHFYILLPILLFYAEKIKSEKTFLFYISLLFVLNNLKLIKFVSSGIL